MAPKASSAGKASKNAVKTDPKLIKVSQEYHDNMSLASLATTDSGTAASSSADKKADGKPGPKAKQQKPVKVTVTARRERFDDSSDLRVKDCTRGTRMTSLQRGTCMDNIASLPILNTGQPSFPFPLAERV